MVKQITKAEKNTLMSILPAYKAHVQARGGASLLQYLSCHSMNMRWQWSGKVASAPPIHRNDEHPRPHAHARSRRARDRMRPSVRAQVYFVVMRNFFPIRPQLSFDLKGATANRRALKTWELHQTNTVAGLYSTLRDWEWMDIGMTTDLEDRDRDKLWSMICADCDFLQKQNLLDCAPSAVRTRPCDAPCVCVAWDGVAHSSRRRRAAPLSDSLLVGIYRPPSTLIPQQKQAALAQLAAQCRGTGAVSRDRQKVYFFGIIDVLEKFSIRWRVQRVVLRLLYGCAMRWTSSDGISAMPPPLYADRFRTFMAHEVRMRMCRIAVACRVSLLVSRRVSRALRGPRSFCVGAVRRVSCARSHAESRCSPWRRMRRAVRVVRCCTLKRSRPTSSSTNGGAQGSGSLNCATCCAVCSVYHRSSAARGAAARRAGSGCGSDGGVALSSRASCRSTRTRARVLRSWRRS
jgi:hypothetical protein